ncbi:UPF0758 domain-containing protein [Pedobacter sp. GR22-10]|uniref:UPF0758 domain-containing protein n=1 Tax=Pedobacter sp. GR22-10 TaxID=2994472 RepID=UPI002246F8F6|nr:UPF0758 domain-containing protein [Pedobacter sp. GR22-10]MCX2429699.1 hypothetical protein [Pedobacter sp. GR22-10]
MKNPNLTTENFSSANRNYFIDFKRAINNSHYICITRSDKLLDGGYRRSNVVVFEEDFHFLVSAFSSLFHAAAHSHLEGTEYCDSQKIGSQKGIKGIKTWAPDMRPREKFIAHGTDALSDAELMAILIGSGRPNQSAVALCEAILKAVGGRLDLLAAQGHKSLSRFKGIGLAKSSAILAALELGRRMCAVD